MKYYKRDLAGMNSIQILKISDDNKFVDIWNEELGAHTTVGFMPTAFEVGKDVPRGFLS